MFPKPVGAGLVVPELSGEALKCCSGLWGEGVGNWCLMGTEFQFGMMKKILEVDGGDGCTIM